MFAFVFDESLFAFAYETPPNAFALLFDRYTTRVYMRNPPLYFQEAPAPVLLPDACATRTTFYVAIFYLNLPDLWL